MKIEPSHYEEAYRYAREVYEGEIGPEAAKKHLTRIGLNSGSAGNYINNFRHMRVGEVYKRAMSAGSTEFFLRKIAEHYGSSGLANAVRAFKAHIQYNGRPMPTHVALLSKYEAKTRTMPKALPPTLPPEVRILPMSPNESDDMSIEKMQQDYFLTELPSRIDGEYRCKTQLHAPEGAAILFQYRGHVVATARLKGSRTLEQRERRKSESQSTKPLCDCRRWPLALWRRCRPLWPLRIV